MGGNPNPKQKLKPLYGEEALADKPLTVRVTPGVDQFVRSLPNRTEWLRKVIAEAAEKEMGNAS